MIDRVEVTDSIAGFDEAEWNAVTRNMPGSHYGLLRAVETESLNPRERRYFSIRVDGRLACVAPVMIAERNQPNGIDGPIFGRLCKPLWDRGVSFGPVLICTTSMGYGNNIGFRQDVPEHERREMAHEICRRFEKEAHRGGLAVGFSAVSENDATLRSVLRERGYAESLSLPVAALDVRWTDFDDYLRFIKSLGMNRYRTVRGEINRFRKSGACIERLSSPGRWERQIIGLLEHHHQRKSGHSFPFKQAFFSRLAQHAGEDLTIYIARLRDELIGVTYLLRKDEAGFLPMVGIDHELAGRNFTYFNITSYAPAEDTTALGIRKLYAGNSVYQAKMNRGCTLERSYVYYKHAKPIRQLFNRAIFAGHRSWYGRKFADVLKISEEQANRLSGKTALQ